MGKNRLRPKPQQTSKDPLPEPELVLEFEGRKAEETKPKEKEETDEESLRRQEKRRLRRQKIRAALDGSVLLSNSVQRYGWLMVYAFFLAMLMIANNYLSESEVREISIIKGELKDLQFRQISSQAELMRISRQSSVADKLQGTGVNESVVPPYKIGGKDELPQRGKTR